MFRAGRGLVRYKWVALSNTTLGALLASINASTRPRPGPPLAFAGFTRIVRWPLILSARRLAAEYSRAEGITIKMVSRGTSAGFADVR